MRLRTALAGTFIAAVAIIGLSAPAFASTTSVSHTQTWTPGNQGGDANHEVLRHCTTQLVVFNFPHGSALLTEVYGPRLRTGEIAFYNSQTYRITGVWFRTFTVSDSAGHPVINHGPSIRHGEAWLLTCW